MNEKELGEMWKVLSSATNIDNLEYGDAVTIGGVFGDMKQEILNKNKENAMLWKWVKQEDEPLTKEEEKEISDYIYNKVK